MSIQGEAIHAASICQWPSVARKVAWTIVLSVALGGIIADPTTCRAQSPSGPTPATSKKATEDDVRAGQIANPISRSDPNDPIERIKDEGMKRSQVMQTLSYLSDVIGPRLTASPNMKRANNWTRETLEKWGMQNAHLEAWGPFGRGWTLNATESASDPCALLR